MNIGAPSNVWGARETNHRLGVGIVRDKWMWLAGAGVALGLVTGCGNFRKNLARQMGVKVVTKRVETKDLGSKYKSLQRTEWDFFAPKKAKGKKVRTYRRGRKVKVTAKLPKRRANITYRHFGVKGVDDFNRAANLLYAQYVFAGRVMDKTHKDLAKLLKLDARKVNGRELARAIARADKEQLSGVRSAQRSKRNVELALRGLSNIVDRAMKLKNLGNQLVSTAPAQFARDPARALFADQAVAELTSSLKKITKVVTGAPGLLKKLIGTKKVVTSAF